VSALGIDEFSSFSLLAPTLHIQIDGVVQRIHINHVLQRIDWDDLLDHVDIDRLIDRIDMEKLVDKLPVEKIVDKSNLKEIVARASVGIFSNIFDVFRVQSIRVDQVIQGMGRCRCNWKQYGYLPPDPKKLQEQEVPCPKKASSLAVAVQGRSAGYFSRYLAFLIDELWLLLCFGVTIALINYVLTIFNGDYKVDKSKWWIPFAFYGFEVLYLAFFHTLLGRTLGKVVMGLLVVRSNGKSVTGAQTLPRAMITSLMPLLIILSLLGLLRRDRRQGQDVVACTTVIYAWDASRFRSNEKYLSDAERLEPVYDSMYESVVKEDLP